MHDERLIGALLRIPFQATVARVREHLSRAGFTDLTMAHFQVFQHLPPRGARITALAAQAQMTKQSMGVLVEHLEQRGYLERRPDPRDKRASLINLTARGRALVEVARAAILELEQEWELQLGTDRMHQLRSTLRVLVSLIEATQRDE